MTFLFHSGDYFWYAYGQWNEFKKKRNSYRIPTAADNYSTSSDTPDRNVVSTCVGILCTAYLKVGR